MKKLLKCMFLVIVLIGFSISCTNEKPTEQKVTSFVETGMASDQEMDQFGINCRALKNHMKARSRIGLIENEHGVLCYNDSIDVKDSIRYFFQYAPNLGQLHLRGLNRKTGETIRSTLMFYNASNDAFDGRNLRKEEYDDFYTAMTWYFMS